MLWDSLFLFSEYKLWEEEIEKWQNPILKDERLPEWYILYSTSIAPILSLLLPSRNLLLHIFLCRENEI
jgi:hypothetical protein